MFSVVCRVMSKTNTRQSLSGPSRLQQQWRACVRDLLFAVAKDESRDRIIGDRRPLIQPLPYCPRICRLILGPSETVQTTSRDTKDCFFYWCEVPASRVSRQVIGPLISRSWLANLEDESSDLVGTDEVESLTTRGPARPMPCTTFSFTGEFWRGRHDGTSGTFGFPLECRVSLMLITMLIAAVGANRTLLQRLLGGWAFNRYRIHHQTAREHG